MMEDQAEDTGGNTGKDKKPDAVEARETPVGSGPDEADEPVPVKDDHGEDGAKLNKDLEDARFFAGEAEEIAHDDEVSRRGDRKELSQALDNAEYDGRPDVVHDKSPCKMDDGGLLMTARNERYALSNLGVAVY